MYIFICFSACVLVCVYVFCALFIYVVFVCLYAGMCVSGV